MSFVTVLVTILALALLAKLAQTKIGFMAQSPEDYKGQGTDFDIRRELNGPILCEGVIYGPLGRVNTRFVANMNASWEGNVGHMTEHFKYDTGGELNREWTLAIKNDNSIDATAPDVIGTGRGHQSGSSVYLNYKLQLPEESGGHILDVTDWMYLMENGTIMNRSQMRKFGLKVGELVATMRKVPA